MTLQEAKIKVLKNGWIKKIGTIAEFEDFWVFCHDDEEIDARPAAIRKKDGSLFWFFYPDYAHLKYKILNEDKGN